MDLPDVIVNNVEDESLPSRKRRHTTPRTRQDMESASVSEPWAEWTPDSLVDSSPNFHHVPRISASVSPDELLKRVLEHEESGIPLIIEEINQQPYWDPTLFSLDGFIGDKEVDVDVRNIETSTDLKMSVRGLVEHYLTVLRTGKNDNKLYGNDIRYPKSWESWLRNNLPEHFHPYSEKSDLTSCLDEQSRPESLMRYIIGIGDTFTPAHKDLCGSFGHNLMCHTTENGSAFWFMTASGALDDDPAAKYFRTKLGRELDSENHVATLEEFRGAPFDVYIAEQRLGDFVLVPPRSCHQVVNRGGITLKMSWSRMGVKSIEYALRSELPRYHRTCRAETYKVKLTLYAAVKNYCRRLSVLGEAGESAIKDRQEVENTLRRLIPLLDEVLIEEWSPEHDSFTHFATDENIQGSHFCNFCGADIFQSFFSCADCSESDPVSEYICCSACCIEGRSCRCGLAIMKPSQIWHFDHLIQERNKAADVLNSQGHGEIQEIRHISYDTLNTSEHLQIFKAACLLRKRKQQWSESKEPIRSCVPNKVGEEAHETLCSNTLRYSRNHTYKCYLHILKLFNMHAGEAILTEEQSGTFWHSRHAPRNVEPSAKLLARMALTYDVCAPVDPKHYRFGFYDKHVLIPTEIPSPQADHASPDLVMNAHEQVQSTDTPSHGMEATYDCNLSQAMLKPMDTRPDSPLTPLSEDDEDEEDYTDEDYISPIKSLIIIPSRKKLEVFIPSFKRKHDASSDSVRIAKRVRVNEPEPVLPGASSVPMNDQDLLIRREKVSLTAVPTGSPSNRNPVREENSGRRSTSLRESNSNSNEARTGILALPTRPLKDILKSPSTPTRVSPMAHSKEPNLMAGIGSSSQQVGRCTCQSERQLNILMERLREKEKKLEKMSEVISEKKRKHDEDFKRKRQRLEDDRRLLEATINISRRYMASSPRPETHEQTMGHIVQLLKNQGRVMERLVEHVEKGHQENPIPSRAAQENCQGKPTRYSPSDIKSVNYNDYFDVDPIQSSTFDAEPRAYSACREDHTTCDETVETIKQRAPFHNDQIIERHTTTERHTVTQQKQQVNFQGGSTPKGPRGWRKRDRRDGSTHKSYHKFHGQHRRDPDPRPPRRHHSCAGQQKSHPNHAEYQSGSMAEGS